MRFVSTRRLRPLLLGAAIAVTGLVGPAQPAAAAPPTNCSVVGSTLEFTGTHVVAEKLRFCDNGDVIELSVSIQRQNASTGQWLTVASGRPAVYKCAGTTSHRYRIGGTTSTGVKFACG